MARLPVSRVVMPVNFSAEGATCGCGGGWGGAGGGGSRKPNGLRLMMDWYGFAGGTGVEASAAGSATAASAAGTGSPGTDSADAARATLAPNPTAAISPLSHRDA